jgi:hypothetical protein
MDWFHNIKKPISDGALVRLRQAVWQRMRWTDVEPNCAGEPISPVPQKPSSDDLAMPIEVDVKPSRSSCEPSGGEETAVRETA